MTLVAKYKKGAFVNIPNFRPLSPSPLAFQKLENSKVYCENIRKNM